MQFNNVKQAGDHLLECFRRNLHWVFLAVAVLLMVARFLPAVYLSVFTSDIVQIPVLFRDVIEQGHAARDWTWGGHSDLFPDVALVFFFKTIVRSDGFFSLYATADVMLAGYVAALVVLYRQAGGRNAQTYAVVLLLFFALLLVNFGVQHGLNFRYLFTPSMHTGVSMMVLICLALFQRIIWKGYDGSFWVLTAVCFLSSASDPIFVVLFLVPMLATSIVIKILYRDRVRCFLPLIANILLSSTAGFRLGPRLSPMRIDAAQYTHFNSISAHDALFHPIRSCLPFMSVYFGIYLALDLFFVLFTLALLVASFRKGPPKAWPPALFVLLVFITCVIGSNWGATILTGIFIDIECARYVRPALLLPVFFLLGYFNHLVPWSKAGSNATISIVSLIISGCAIFLPPAPNFFYKQMQQLVPVIEGIMEREHIKEGLADYWYADSLNFVSRDAIRTRSVTADGSLFHWMSDLAWYTGDTRSGAPPRFRMILMANLDPQKIKERYGAPARIIPTPIGADVWIYSGEKSISYNPIVGGLSNGPVNEYHIPAKSLQSLTGGRTGDSILALPDRDKPGFLSYGPYLHLKAGRYRIKISYDYLSAPAPDQLTRYDVTVWNASMTKFATLTRGALPFIDGAPHEFNLDIAITNNDRDAVEIRTFYPGSGSIRLDSLHLTYVGQ